ncbi:MAG: DUF1254 domain-containing protein [Thalassotalea sp.]|nr:DUF1254 domain-containing protein [Thalassotalea sp.]MDG2394665.1 DUF1254 domain-containing protein [Thalassotalea sp.]
MKIITQGLIAYCMLLGTSPIANAANVSQEEIAAISVPNSVESSIGALNYQDGAPTKETAEKLYDYVDLMHAVKAYNDNQAPASMFAMRRGYQSLGVHKSNQVIIHEKPQDANAIYLVANSQTLYVFNFLDLKTDGPLVLESSPKTLGFLNSMWQTHIADIGVTGADKGKGGKYLILPPNYQGEVPKGYIVIRSPTYGIWYASRGFLTNGNPEPSLSIIKNSLRIYPLAKANNPPKTEFIDATGKQYNTVTRNDFQFFEDLNAVVQAEPIDSLGAERRGVLKAIGIEKGKQFSPDARMKGILTDAVNIGHGYFRALWWQPKDKANASYPDDKNSHWMTGFPNRNTTFIEKGAMELNSRLRMHGIGTGVTPAMSSVAAGKGSDYAFVFVDKEGERFDGGQTYKLTLPANIPVANFWSIIVYDAQTRSYLPTSQSGAMLSSVFDGLKANADGSTDIYFGPKAPKGHESNWLETLPNKSWFICLRMYGPTEAWLNATWRPSEIELLK